MTDPSCDTVGPLLVDYSDGQLPEAESARVAAHLAECPRCRSELASLERSLELARYLWDEAAARAPSTDSGGLSTRRVTRRTRAAVAVAACAMLLLLAAGAWWLVRGGRPSEDDPIRVAVPVPPTGQAEEPPPVAPAEDRDIDAVIARAGRAAELAASVRLMATQPGLQPFRQRAEHYLARTYRDTPAGDEAATRIGAGANKEPES